MGYHSIPLSWWLLPMHSLSRHCLVSSAHPALAKDLSNDTTLLRVYNPASRSVYICFLFKVPKSYRKQRAIFLFLAQKPCNTSQPHNRIVDCSWARTMQEASCFASHSLTQAGSSGRVLNQQQLKKKEERRKKEEEEEEEEASVAL